MTTRIDSLVRTIYDALNDQTCEKLIQSYLTGDTSSLDQLGHLQLAPDQTRAGLTDDQFTHFKFLIPGFREKKHPEAVKEKLKSDYPLVWKRILTQLAADQRLKASGQAATGGYAELLGKLREKMIGQRYAVERVATAIDGQLRADKNFAFLFVGPTGVGKTELARVLTALKEANIVEYAMSKDAADETQIGDFLGSGSGYLGSGDAPLFMSRIRDNLHPTHLSTKGAEETFQVTNGVILFDEFEKATPRIKQAMLGLLNDGRISFNYTRKGPSSQDSKNVIAKYRFRKCVFIGTSNLCAELILKEFRGSRREREISALFLEKAPHQPPALCFSPELLARMEPVPFGPIPRGPDGFQRIIHREMSAFTRHLTETDKFKGAEISKEDALVSCLETHLYGEGIALRAVKLYFQPGLLTSINNKMVEIGGTRETTKIVLSVDQGTPCIKFLTYLTDLDEYLEEGQVPICN